MVHNDQDDTLTNGTTFALKLVDGDPEEDNTQVGTRGCHIPPTLTIPIGLSFRVPPVRRQRRLGTLDYLFDVDGDARTCRPRDWQILSFQGKTATGQPGDLYLQLIPVRHRRPRCPRDGADRHVLGGLLVHLLSGYGFPLVLSHLVDSYDRSLSNLIQRIRCQLWYRHDWLLGNGPNDAMEHKGGVVRDISEQINRIVECPPDEDKEKTQEKYRQPIDAVAIRQLLQEVPLLYRPAPVWTDVGTLKHQIESCRCGERKRTYTTDLLMGRPVSQVLKEEDDGEPLPAHWRCYCQSITATRLPSSDTSMLANGDDVGMTRGKQISSCTCIRYQSCGRSEFTMAALLLGYPVLPPGRDCWTNGNAQVAIDWQYTHPSLCCSS